MSREMGSCARRATVRPPVNSRAAPLLSPWLSWTWPRKLSTRATVSRYWAVVPGEVVVTYLPQLGLALAEQVGGAGVIAAQGREVSQHAQDRRGQDHPQPV